MNRPQVYMYPPSEFLFLYLWLHWVFVAHRLFLVAVSGGYSSVAVLGLLSAVASPVVQHDL